MTRVLAMIMAGGLGERLQPLTQARSKAAVPFGGKFRLIDFTLSNCVNSGLRQIYVLTQHRSESLNRHIQNGWALSASGLGDFIYCVPAQQKLGTEWYRGTADAVRQNLNLFRAKDFEHVLVLSGDHIYKMNYLQLITYHVSRGAGLTLSAIRVPENEARGRLGVLEVDKESRLVGFEEKPAQPKTLPDAPDYTFASMGVYLFRTDTLVQALEGEGDDFGKHIIPRMLTLSRDTFVYDYEKQNRIEDVTVDVRAGIRERVVTDRTRDSSYWLDVGTLDSYYEASMDLLGVDPIFNLYGERWSFRTWQRPLPPSKFILGGKATESIVSDGCIISGGTVWNSILSPGVIVERDAVVEQSVVFDDVVIEPGAKVRGAILDKDSRVRAGASIGYDPEADRRRGCTISEKGIAVVPKEANIFRSEPNLF